MNKRPPSSTTRLPVQLISSFIALVILTALAVGVPAILATRSQLDRQAWTVVEEGGNTTLALIAARQADLSNLALVTAQRPTLLQLAQDDDPDALSGYLRTLQVGAGLDALVICSRDDQPLAQSGLNQTEGWCGTSRAEYFIQADGPGRQAWMVSAQPILDGSTLVGRVVVGAALNKAFAERLRSQTGLEQAFLLDGQPLASSLPAAGWQATSESEHNTLAGETFTLGGAPYDAVRLPLGDSGLEALVALPVAENAAAQQRLTYVILGSILGVSALGSLLGVFMARRVSRPLGRLGDAARALRKGNLTTPITIYTRVSEVALLASALEDARVALQASMTQARREKEWMELLLESIVEGIVTLDQHGRITFFSAGAERMTGWKQEQVIGRSCDEIFQPVENETRFSQLLPAPGRRAVITLALRDGRQVTLAVTGARLAPPEAGKARTVLVLRDVSDEEAVHRLLGNFLANIAHEFRTPLSALAASVELFKDQLADLSPAEQGELLNSIHLGTLHLQTLIDNLLEGASIESGRFRVYPRPCQAGEMAAEAARLMRPLLDKYNQRLSLEIPATLPPVQADPRRTGQVFANLLSNAIKFNPAGSEITLSLAAEPGAVRVSIADRGPGVPPEQRAELFRRFAHIDNGSDRAEAGAGLGLSVVKAIVEAQGGQVGVADRAGGGALFWFTLPLAQPEPAQELPA